MKLKLIKPAPHSWHIVLLESTPQEQERFDQAVNHEAYRVAIEESLRLVHPAAIPCQLRPEHRGDRAWELDSDNVFAVLGCAYAIGQSLGAALELDHFGT